MSDYSVQIDWSGKDSLPDSSADKIISGADFQTEFDQIETDMATKADINGNATESFSCATPASGSDTTVAATTEWVNDAIAAAVPEAFPVGSVFISVVSTNPATLLGYGTWSAFAEGRMLVGIKSTDTDFDTVEETGGAKTHTLTVDEMPSHAHDVVGMTSRQDTWNEPILSSVALAGEDTGSTTTDSGFTVATGGGSAHSIMNPYIVTYMWKRTA